MNNIRDLFFHLTPTTLAAIVADLDDNDDMESARRAAIEAGWDCVGATDFSNMVREAREERDGNDQRAEDINGYNGEVAATLARQGR